jgi:hypothetical protein
MNSLSDNATKNYKKRITGGSTNVLLPLIAEQARKEQVSRDGSRDWEHLHPSEMAKNDWCERASYYRMTGVEKSNKDPYGPLNLRRLNVFTEGHSIHDKWQKWMQSAGVLYGRFVCKDCKYSMFGQSDNLECPECGGSVFRYAEMPVVDEALMVLGHADGVVRVQGVEYVVEIKSVGVGTIKWEAPALYEPYANDLDGLWKAIKRPLASHLRQVMLYMHFLNIDLGIVIYEWKPTQEVKEFAVKYMPEVIDPIIEKAERLQQALMSGNLPERPEQATGRGCSMCSMCEYKKECWS